MQERKPKRPRSQKSLGWVLWEDTESPWRKRYFHGFANLFVVFALHIGPNSVCKTMNLLSVGSGWFLWGAASICEIVSVPQYLLNQASMTRGKDIIQRLSFRSCYVGMPEISNKNHLRSIAGRTCNKDGCSYYLNLISNSFQQSEQIWPKQGVSTR